MSFSGAERARWLARGCWLKVQESDQFGLLLWRETKRFHQIGPARAVDTTLS